MFSWNSLAIRDKMHVLCPICGIDITASLKEAHADFVTPPEDFEMQCPHCEAELFVTSRVRIDFVVRHVKGEGDNESG